MAVRGVLVAVCGGRAVTLRSGACANVGCVCAVVLQVYDKALAVMTRVVKGTDGVAKTRRELAGEWRCEEGDCGRKGDVIFKCYNGGGGSGGGGSGGSPKKAEYGLYVRCHRFADHFERALVLKNRHMVAATTPEPPPPPL